MYTRLLLPLAASFVFSTSMAQRVAPLAAPQIELGADEAETDAWFASDPLGDALEALQSKRFAEAREHLAKIENDPGGLYLLGSMLRYGSLGKPDLAGAAEALEASARGRCPDAAVALADMIDQRVAESTGPARAKAQRDSEAWRVRAVAMGYADAAVDASMAFVPVGEIQGTLDAATKASAARAIAWARIAVKERVEVASDLEAALVRDFPSAVPNASAMQNELEGRIESERSQVDGVYRLQVPAEMFMPEGAGSGDGRAAFDAAYALYEREDYAAALDAFFPLAKDGDAEAAFYVGRIHEMGYVGRPNGPVAERWYVRAAEAGIHVATANLGYMYMEGRGVPKNASRATDYFLLAAYGGNLEGVVNVGFAYGTGQGRTKDVVEAHAWYSLGADQGMESASKNRGIIEREMSRQQIEAAGRRRTALEAELRGEARPAKALPMLGSKRSRLPMNAPAPAPAPADVIVSAPEGPSTSGQVAAAGERIEIHDDLLGGLQSHEVTLPDGWSFDAGLSWNPRDAIAHANVEGVAFLPSGAEVQFLPSGSFTYYDEIQGAPSHPAEGDFVGGAMFLKPGAGPEDFVTRIILPSYRAQATGVKVTGVTEAEPVSRVYADLMAPMVEQMTSGASQPGVSVKHSVSCPVIRVGYTERGRAMEEEISFLYARFDMTMEMGQGQSMTNTLWYVLDTRSLRAPVGELDALRPAMRRIATSLRPTRAWAATVDHIRATFYGDPETFQALQGTDHGTAVERIKAHAAPLGDQRDSLIEKAAQNWNELQTTLKRLEDAWAETLGATTPRRGKGGFRLR